MRHVFILATILAILGLIAAACGGGGGDGTDGGGPTPTVSAQIIPIPGNSELVVGPNRFALGLIDEENEPVQEEPGTTVRLRFYFQGAAGEELREEADAVFVWAIPDATGFYTANVTFDEAGQWKAEAMLTRDGEETVVSFTFPVRAESLIPIVGDPAVPSSNLTLAQEPNIKRLSTDQEPEPALYEMTIAQALETGKPTLIVFATPAFCQTRFCGPMVDNVRAVREEFVDQVNFIHIEPFELDDEGQLVSDAQGSPVVAEPMLEWNLLTEPWIFVVDAEGRIAARIEGAASPQELREALQAVVG